MSSSQEMCLPESTEIDSEEGGSSCEERESRRRTLGVDPENLPSKKRRKQSTPIKFPTTSTTHSVGGEEYDEEAGANDHQTNHHHRDDYDRAEGKPATIKDENLNNEFRCQFCSQFFDNRVALVLHLECEHSYGNTQQSSRESPPQRASPETSGQSVSPINLSGISIRNFATSNPAWLSGQGQITPSEATLAAANLAASRNSNHFQQMPGFPGPLAQFLPMPGFSLHDATQMQRAALGFPKIFNPDAYCDLCNKEFCNKYFLKTHKANKHGIYTDPPASSQPLGVDSQPFLAASSPITSLSSSMKLDQPQRPEGNGLPQQPTVPCDMCPTRFTNEDSLRKHRHKVHLNPNHEADSTQSQMNLLPSSSGDEERQSPGGMESLFKQEYSIDQDESSYPPTPRTGTTSPAQQIKDFTKTLNGDRLRRIGVMNPEAYCELCCKEFNNKHCLRMHKLKRHGMFVPDNDKSPPAPGSAAWHQVQSAPLNLIMADSFNGSETEDPGEECACKTCGIRFQSQSLYQLHVETIHGSREQSPSRAESDSVEQRTDAISEDLQKLQTMILQLNGLDSNKAASCALCGKDYDTASALRNHMIAEHGVMPENLSASPQQTVRDNSPPTAYCGLCEKDLHSQGALKKHISEDHQPSTPTSSTPQSLPTSVTSTPKSHSSQPSERKPVANITPTSSYCEICNKELCNKYFMKTHMQKMHGIEIENGSQIGGVVCNICNKELCSKYFLRVHKQNTHGIVEEGAGTGKQENFEAPPSSEDLALKPEQLGDLNLRYITHFTEVCPICSRRFRSPKWLKVHLQGEHGKTGVDKWREIEQYHQTLPKIPPRVPSVPKSPQQQQQSPHGSNSSLRIPNGFEPNPQIRADLAALGNQMLSNFFGSAGDDQQGQSYRCSQPGCNFSTSILPLFFLHERSHGPQQPESPSAENERMLQCPLCAQAFSQPESLRDHIISRHPSPFPGLLSQFPLPLLNNFAMANEQQERNDYPEIKKDADHLRQPSPQIMNEIDTNKMKRQEENNVVQVMPQGAYKCSQCGYATANLNRIKKHVKKDHRSLGDPAEMALAELSKTLKDVANKHKVPASYAIPQDASLTPDKTIMQPFIIEESEAGAQNGGGCDEDKRFAPALVFLPVKTRVSGSLTLSFTLNPA